MVFASRWAQKLRLNKSYQITYSFPAGITAHRAIGIPQPDNSNSVTIMKFEPKPTL